MGTRDIKARQKPLNLLTKENAFGEIDFRKIPCDCLHWDLREPCILGIASFLESGLSPCAQKSFHLFYRDPLGYYF